MGLVSLSEAWCRRVRAALAGLLAFAAVAGLSLTNLGQNLEHRALDLCYTLRPDPPPPPDLLIVGIDETSFQELQCSWPWPRHFHAALVKELSEAGARLIIFDVLFADPSHPEEDQAFAEVIREAGNVILAHSIEKFETPTMYRQTLVEPLEMFRQAAKGVALFVVTPDTDGVVRHFRLRLGEMTTMPALVAQFLGRERRLPPDLTGLINYCGPPGSIEIIPFYQFLDPEHLPPPAKIRNRIVLVGRTLQSLIDPLTHADVFFTPFFLGTRESMSGVEMQANILHTVLQGNWGTEMTRAARLALSFVLLLGFSFLVIRFPPLPGLALLSGSLVLLAFASLSLFMLKNFWMPPLLAILGLSLVYGIHAVTHLTLEVKEKRWLRQAFGRYVSPALVEFIAEHPELLELGGEEVDATILFADLAGFTAQTETMPPKEVIRLLEEYFTVMTQIILIHKGTVDKYIGDAIMCFWGAPVPLPDHAARACRAALDMQKAMSWLKEFWLSRAKAPLALRIGLHSGRVVAGNVGSRDRFNYTVMGDAVNLAHRLEGLNRYYGSEILLSEPTFQLVRESFLIRELDHILVKGRIQTVKLYELLGNLLPKNPPGPELALFAEGLAAYRSRDWTRAKERFKEVLRLNPRDASARLYLERAGHFLKKPPPADWQGIHKMGAGF